MLKTPLPRSVAEEDDGLFHLSVVVVELRHDGVGSEPAVGGELAVFGSEVGRRAEGLASHVAGLAGGDLVLEIEGKRGLLGEGGELPLVVEEDGALPLVIVELLGESGFVAGGAVLAGLVEVLHDCLGVAVEVGEDFFVGDFAVMG